MTSKLNHTILSITFLAVLSIGAAAQQPNSGATQPSVSASPEAQLLKVLIEEVRILRTAILRNNLSIHKTQTLTEQMVRQQNRVDSLSEEIEQLKIQIQQATEGSRDEADLKELEEAYNSTTDPQQRAALQQTYASTKHSILRQREVALQEAERNRGRQQQLEATLRNEQAKLAEIHEQLESIDRDFERQNAEIKKGVR